MKVYSEDLIRSAPLYPLCSTTYFLSGQDIIDIQSNTVMLSHKRCVFLRCYHICMVSQWACLEPASLKFEPSRLLFNVARIFVFDVTFDLATKNERWKNWWILQSQRHPYFLNHLVRFPLQSNNEIEERHCDRMRY